jgi:hypothetical protein
MGEFLDAKHYSTRCARRVLQSETLAVASLEHLEALIIMAIVGATTG